MKKLDNFQKEQSSIDCNCTMVLRIKVTGIDDEEALDFLREKLKCRIHEEEMLLVDKNRVSKGVMTEKSKDHQG